MQSKIAVFPGSFDPFTLGHYDIVQRSLSLFDQVIVAVGVNALKKGMFEVEERLSIIKQAFAGNSQVVAKSYQGLTIDFCEKEGARFMLRGVRNSIDFEYEKSIAQMNASMRSGIETVLLFTDARHSAINSSIVRDILRNNGKIEKYLPPNVVLPARFSRG